MTERIFNQSEEDERRHLAHVRERIHNELPQNTDPLEGNYADVIELKQYLQGSKADRGHVEKIAIRRSIEQVTRAGEHRMTRHRQRA